MKPLSHHHHYRHRIALTLCAVALSLLAACAAPDKGQAQRSKLKPTPDESHSTMPVVAQVGSTPAGHFLQQTGVDPELLLNRLSWGANASSSAQLAALGIDRYLDQQLRNRKAVLPADIQRQIDAMTITQQPFDQMMLALESRREASAKLKGTDDSLRKSYQRELTAIAREASSRSLLRAVYSPNQLQEQMSWFWMNHFNISNKKANLRAMLGDFEESAIRPYALGNFRDLLRATIMHPAMLRYLDNEHNAVGRMNENYARELMELHTMGVGSGYTQNDVQELARVLTGLGVRLKIEAPRMRPQFQKNYVRQGLFEFSPQRHDFGDKQLLGKKIRGRGLDEIEDVLTLLCRQPATARFISHKLALYFVSDSPSPELIARMAQRFLQTDGDIAAVLKTMFYTPEFVASLGSKYKDPLHYVISAMRLTYDGVHIVNTDPMLKWLNTMGQLPNGHPTPDGYSMLENAWASPAQMTVRFDVAKAIASGSPALFKADNEETQVRPRDMPRPNLASADYAKNWARKFSPTTQEALRQARTPQEWGTFFLATPEMMRR